MSEVNDSSSLTRPARRKRNKPCENCRKRRRKCVFPSEEAPVCDRCKRLGVRCYFVKDMSVEERQALLARAKSQREADSSASTAADEVDNTLISREAEIESLQAQIQVLQREMQSILARPSTISVTVTPVTHNNDNVSDSLFDLFDTAAKRTEHFALDDLLQDYAPDSGFNSSSESDLSSALLSLNDSISQGTIDDAQADLNGSVVTMYTEYALSTLGSGQLQPCQLAITQNGACISVNIKSLQDLHLFIKHVASLLGLDWNDQNLNLPSGTLPRSPSITASGQTPHNAPPRVFLTNPQRGNIGQFFNDRLNKAMRRKSLPDNTPQFSDTITREEAIRWIPSIINCFLNDIYPTKPLVSITHLISMYNTNEDPLASPFFTALGACMVTIVWWDQDAFPGFPRDAGYARRLGTYYYAQSRSAMEDNFDTPSLYNVLALLCLQLYCMNKLMFNEGRRYLDHARLLLRTMEPLAGTRSFPDTADMNPKTEKELTNRLAWVIMSMSVRFSHTMHRKMDPPKNEPSEDLRAYINNLALPQPLPCEDEACRLTVRAYGHLISLSKLTSGHNHETSDAVSQLLVQDLWDYRKVGMVPLDVFMGIESALARFYDDLEDELKWGDPNDQLTEQALLECDASYAIRLIMQHFYTLQLWMNIRFLPSDLTKMETPTSATQQFLHHALQRSITAANNLCILAAYSTKYTKNNIDLQLLMLSCEVQYSVAQLGSSSPALSQQAQRHLAMSIAVLKTWFARVHGGNAANYTNKTWDNVAFKQWLKGAGIDYDTLDFDKLLGTYTSGAELISGDSLMALRAKQENTIVLDILEEALVSGFMSMGISDV